MRTIRSLAIGAGMTALVWGAPVAAWAAETAAAPEDPIAAVGKAVGAGLAIGLAALGAGIAQGHIGAAAAGTVAERPEAFTQVLVLTALPEIIVLLGFVMAFLINA
jgi:V/A-type H+-transporting ATPase subunit K